MVDKVCFHKLHHSLHIVTPLGDEDIIRILLKDVFNTEILQQGRLRVCNINASQVPQHTSHYTGGTVFGLQILSGRQKAEDFRRIRSVLGEYFIHFTLYIASIFFIQVLSSRNISNNTKEIKIVVEIKDFKVCNGDTHFIQSIAPGDILPDIWRSQDKVRVAGNKLFHGQSVDLTQIDAVFIQIHIQVIPCIVGAGYDLSSPKSPDLGEASNKHCSPFRLLYCYSTAQIIGKNKAPLLFLLSGTRRKEEKHA